MAQGEVDSQLRTVGSTFFSFEHHLLSKSQKILNVGQIKEKISPSFASVSSNIMIMFHCVQDIENPAHLNRSGSYVRMNLHTIAIFLSSLAFKKEKISSG